MRFASRHVTAAVVVAVLAVTATPALAQKNPLKEAYFGETHVHTSWSFDAYIFGNRITGPADAYKYAKGETIKHPLGYDIKVTTPLDWMGVTDHSEYVGTIRLANTPGSAISKLPIAQKLIVRTLQVGDVLHSGELGAPSSYAIKDGKIVTSIGNQGYEVTVYKVGDKYFGARSNEFGYANYEVVPAPVNLNNLGTVEKSPF